jgi:pyruvate,water dikinase
VVLECARGSCDALVSGTVTPNRYYLNRSTLAVEEAFEVDPMDPSAVRAAAAQALSIEQTFGEAQDVEYGMAGATVHILQARPAPR